MSMDSRDQFEAWAMRRAERSPSGLNKELLDRYDDGDGDYRQAWVSSAWEGWQASREAVVVELPSAFWPGYIEEVDGEIINDDLFTKTQAVEAIEAAGVKVKS